MGRKVIDWVLKPEVSGKNQKFELTFWGGEPLLEWEMVKELIEYGLHATRGTGKQFQWNMTTNGLHLQENTLMELKERNVPFLLSLDGAKERHDRTRKLPNGQGSFDLIQKNFPVILKHYPGMATRLTLTEENVNHFAEDMIYMHSQGFNRVTHCLSYESAWDPDARAELKNQLNMLADWFIDEKRKGNQPLYVKYIHEALKRMLYPQQKPFYCGAGRGYMGISTEGALYPCHRFHNFGDTRPWQEQETCFGQVDYGITRPEWRQQFLESNKHKDPKCDVCPAHKNGECQGGCFAVNWGCNGNINQLPVVGCFEMEVTNEIAKRVYTTLVREKVDAFRYNLQEIHKEMNSGRRVQACELNSTMQAQGSNTIEVLQAAAKIINSSIAKEQTLMAMQNEIRQLKAEMEQFKVNAV
jgi:uncharacterized protein